MFDDDLFDHLTPRGTHEIVLHGVHVPADNPKPVVLIAKFCGRNSPFLNALTKAKPIADDSEATERAATLFAKLGITDWRNVLKDGQPVPYTPEYGAELLHKLIRAKRPELADAAISRAMNADNYRAPVVDPGDVGKG